ncbi:MAG: double-strand break repair protein AddB [Rhodospirillaceae bacterium]|nr:double-strand break repair protein AddB [Rhodospirillaceae bacterium]
MSETQPGPNVFTIPAGQPFVDALAAGLLARSSGGAAELADSTVLLPTRRALRSLREAFLRQSGGAPLLLPRMMPLGDIDEDALAIVSAEDLPGGAHFDVAPAIPALQRRLALTKLVLKQHGGDISLEQASTLAAELAHFLDQVQTERLSFDGLKGLVSEDYAEHWQITLEFLTILTQHWPGILAEKDAIDPALRRNQILEAQAEHWRCHPPAGPVIAAGSTGSIPATAELLSVIAGLPAGALVLPGLDTELDPASVSDVPHHPQFGMMALLDGLDVAPADVPVWPSEMAGEPHAGRARLIAEVMRPARETSQWRRLSAPDEATLAGLQRIDCPGTEDEARLIALMMREALETPARTAALVTPDRRLARRVAAELKRWHIAVDDSAGLPLAHTGPGAFLNLTAELVAGSFTPVGLLSLGKHPLAALGRAPATLRREIRALEMAVLRGPRPEPGLADLILRLEKNEKKKRPELIELLQTLEEAAKPFAEILTGPPADLSVIAKAHAAFAEAVAASEANPGPDRLWSGDAGETAAAFIDELLQAADALGPIDGASYPGLLQALMAGRAVRPRFGSHARLFIWGLLEARLQRTDLLILGGLNEGTWPMDVGADPWMSRPMRRQFGLAPPERRIGLAAHDFAQAFSAPEVTMTRALRVDGVPTVPSRWLKKLDTILTGAGAGDYLFPSDQWLHWQAQLDAPASQIRIGPASYRPPLEARPRQLSVTQVETWMRDPYAIYARHILRLRELPELDAPPDRADYGTIIHGILDKFTAAHPAQLAVGALDELLEMGRQEFGRMLAQPGIWAFWWPKFERIAAWFVETEAARRTGIERIHSETKGTLRLEGPCGTFTLTAIADRIEILSGGGIGIGDYKTGAVPSAKEVAAGFSPQLPLEAAIAVAGGFDGIEAGEVTALDYWRLTGTEPAGQVRSAGGDAGELADEAHEGVLELITRFDDPATPYEARPRPAQAPRYSAYEHLARIKEWTAADGGEDA